MAKASIVKRIVIEIGGKELSLTVDDARGLMEALRDVLGAKEVVHYPVYRSYPVYPWVTTCGSISGTTASTSLTYSGNTASLSS